MVNKTEIMGKEWLEKTKNYKEKDIIKNSGTPDYICSDGQRYEVKYFNGGKLMFTNHQIKSLKENDNIIVFDKQKYIGEFLWKNRKDFFIKIYCWDANRNPRIVINKNTKKRLDNLKEYPGNSYDDVINRLLNIVDKKNGS